MFVFSRLDVDHLWQTIVKARPGWYALAVLVYGLLFLPAARRWHLVLALTGQAVNGKATLQATMTGHLFYLLFFGAVGGDAMRSAWYARRFGLSLPAVLATAPADRLLGFLGLLVVGATTIGLALVSGAPAWTNSFQLRWPSIGIVAASLLIAGIAILALGRRQGSFARAFVQNLYSHGKALLKDPRKALQGVGCGVLVQIALSGTLALNLHAVSHTPLPWATMAWTFPLISLVGALPITVAGLGARETAAFALLALFGIAPEQAVAASLLTMSANLVWAAVGGLVWWQASLADGKPRERRLTPAHRV